MNKKLTTQHLNHFYIFLLLFSLLPLMVASTYGAFIGFLIVVLQSVAFTQAMGYWYEKEAREKREEATKHMETMMKWADESDTCQLPPPGWLCYGDKGHEGPCAAWPISKEIV